MNAISEVREIIAANLGVSTTHIGPESKASDFSEWDSIHHLLLLMEIEERFGVKFALEEMGDLDSVSKITAAVQKRVSV